MNSGNMPAREGQKHDELDAPEDDPLLEGSGMGKKSQRKLNRQRILMLLSHGILISICLVLGLEIVRLREVRSFENGFDTDMHVAMESIELIEYKFTGGIQIDERSQLYREIDPSEPQYVGDPTPEIDKAWDDLLKPVDLIIEKRDTHGIEKSSVSTPDGKLILTLDVYHALHCINLVRQAIDFSYYHPTGKAPYFYRSHVDHCLDYMRQAAQCQSDLTPLTYAQFLPKHTNIPVFGTPHTCRNFSRIHEWAMERRMDKSV